MYKYMYSRTTKLLYTPYWDGDLPGPTSSGAHLQTLSFWRCLRTRRNESPVQLMSWHSQRSGPRIQSIFFLLFSNIVNWVCFMIYVFLQFFLEQLFLELFLCFFWYFSRGNLNRTRIHIIYIYIYIYIYIHIHICMYVCIYI